MKKNPLLTAALALLGVAIVMAAIDMWRKRNKTTAAPQVDESQCAWQVTFRKGVISVLEWPVLYQWLHNHVPFNVTNDNTITVTLNATLYKALIVVADKRGWKYDREQKC